MRSATVWRGRAWPATPHGPAARGERGSATAELAVALPAVVLLLLAGLTSVAAVTARLQCVDAAREAALVSARGGSGTEAAARLAPDGAEVTVTVDGDTVVAVVRARVPVLSVRLPAVRVEATAVAAIEPGHPGPSP